MMRWFATIVLIALGVAALGAAWLLVPAHLQVRRVEPALPDAAQLRELTLPANGPVAIRYVDTSSQNLPRGTLTHSVFVIDWANGKSFMIDAGMDEPSAIEFGKLMETALGADPAVAHGTISELLGDRVRRIFGVAFTHLHIDHTQGIVNFCEARGPGARAYQTAWQAELHNFNTTEGAAIVSESCLTPERLGREGISTIDEFPGLGIVALGGHTPGSTLFAVAIDNRIFLLSGDTTNTKADLLANAGKGFLYSYLLVPENTARTEALRRWLAELAALDDMTVVVSHDLADIQAGGIPEYTQ